VLISLFTRQSTLNVVLLLLLLLMAYGATAGFSKAVAMLWVPAVGIKVAGATSLLLTCSDSCSYW
jgi:hypothetical protein